MAPRRRPATKADIGIRPRTDDDGFDVLDLLVRDVHVVVADVCEAHVDVE
jgi:hypothetical protein